MVRFARIVVSLGFVLASAQALALTIITSPLVIPQATCYTRYVYSFTIPGVNTSPQTISRKCSAGERAGSVWTVYI